METWGLTFLLFLLITGVILTVITIRRMATGAIAIPHWAKVLLVIGMVMMQIILLLSMLPPIRVDKIFVNESTSIVIPIDSISVDSDASIQAVP